MRYKFNEIAINSVEKRIPTEDDKANYIGLEHLESGSLSVSTWGSAVSLKGEKLVMRKGDVLFGKRNTYLRRASIAPHDGLFSAHGMVLRPKPGVIDPSFFPFFVNSDEFFNSTIRISVGSLSPTVNWKDMKELEFDLPPIEKQRELAELLWAANDLKESYKKLIAATDEMLKAKFREMFGECDARESFGNIVDIINGYAFKSSEYVSEGIRIIRIANVQKGYIEDEMPAYYPLDRESEISKFKLYNGDLLISLTGNVGRVAILTDDFLPAALNQRVACLRLKHDAKADLQFLFTLMNHDDFEKDCIKYAGGSAQKNMSTEWLKRYEIPLPPLSLQQEFVEIARKADETRAALKRSIADLESVIKGLINR